MGRVWSPLLHREKGGAGVASQIIWSLANVGREMARNVTCYVEP